MLIFNNRFWGFVYEMIVNNYRPARAPYRLLFYLTRRCNCRCRNCRIWEMPPGPEISTEEVQLIFRNARPYLRWLHLSGGEIFLRSDIQDLIRTAAEELSQLLILQFATNCTLPDRVLESCRIIASSGIPKSIVTLSMDGIGRTHDELRGVPGLFDKVIELYHQIKKLHSPSIQPYLGMTITRSNAGQVPRMVKILGKDYGIKRGDIHYNFYHPSALYYQNDRSEITTLDQARRVINFLNSPRSWKNLLLPSRFLENRYRRLYLPYLRTGQSPLGCEAFRGALSIDSEGQCYPCLSYQRSAGHVKDFNYQFELLWRSPAVQDIRRAITENKCPQCWTPCEAFPTMLTHILPGHKSG